ncbi:MAG: hypothetical protein AB6733_23310 [Clostridiaceae bacterium]
MNIDDLLKITLENIKVIDLINKNYSMNKIRKAANEDLEKNNYKIILSPNHYKNLDEIIKDEYGYKRLRGKKNGIYWEPLNKVEEVVEQFSLFDSEKVEENPIKAKKEDKKTSTSQYTKEVSNNTIDNGIKTILNKTNEILSEIRTLKNIRSTSAGYTREEKDLIKTILASYGTEQSIYKKIVIPKNLDDELSKIVFDRYSIKKGDIDYFSKVLVLAMMLLSKP